MHDCRSGPAARSQAIRPALASIIPEALPPVRFLPPTPGVLGRLLVDCAFAKMRLLATPSLVPTGRHPHTLPACQPVGRCALQMGDWEERPMENINKAGPSEKRREELRLVMQKMKESGKLGGTGMMNDFNVGGSLEGSKTTNGTAADSGEWYESNGQWFKADAEGAQVRPLPPKTPAESPPPISSEGAETAAADPAEDLLEDGRPKSTASVGGRWVAPQEVDKLEKNTPSVGRRRELT